MKVRSITKFARAHQNVLLAVIAVLAAITAFATSLGERGAESASSANFKLFAVVAALAFLIRLVGHRDQEEEGSFIISSPQGPLDPEITHIIELD
ncbi:MAG: hypothetical protein MUC50_19595 [Myxococcota bacterium]|jgi:hypothetical protein|nr:hypothetical protein [Myxococcota bacterium]